MKALRRKEDRVEVIAFIAFAALVVAWVALPVRNGHLEATEEKVA